MKRITLVCTVHEETEGTTVTTLCAILERVLPEVIFLEVPPAAFGDYYESCTRANLESRAARWYRESHQVKLIPVDLPTPERDFFENYDRLIRRVREESSEYRQLMRNDRSYLSKHGFAYLNSVYCSQLWSDVYKEILSSIGRIGDSGLFEIYDTWRETLELREMEMMKNILEYCGGNIFGTGAFLIGAAHRQPIIDKSREQSAIDSTRLEWDFDSVREMYR